MAIEVQLSGTGTNGTDIDALTPEVGGAWTKVAGNIEVQSNRLYCQAGPALAVSPVTPSAADYDVGATFNRVSGTGSTTYILGRRDGSGNFYYARVTTADIVLGEFTSPSTFSAKATYASGDGWSPSTGVDYDVVLRFEGADITVLLDGAPILTANDATLSGAGEVGIFAPTTVSSANGWHVSDFYCLVGGTGIEGTGSATFGLTAAATGTVAIAAAASALFGLTTSAAATIAVEGAAAALFGLTTAATGAVRVAGDAAATFGLTATATGALAIAGAGTAPFGLTASGAGDLDGDLSGVGVAQFGLTVSAAGTLAIAATAAATFGLTASATGTTALTAAGAAAFGLTTAGTGAVGLAATGGATFGLTTSAAGALHIAAAASAVFGLTSSGAATIGAAPELSRGFCPTLLLADRYTPRVLLKSSCS